MLIKHDGSTILKYPYSIIDLQNDYPNTIFTLPLTEESLIDFPVSFVTESPRPEYDPIEYNLSEDDPEYNNGEWIQRFKLTEVSEAEKTIRYNSRANWRQFYNNLLINPAFQAARAAATQSNEINVAYTDAANALGLAALGLANVFAIQACFDNLCGLLTGNYELTLEQKTELEQLLQNHYLDKLVTLNWA